MCKSKANVLRAHAPLHVHKRCESTNVQPQPMNAGAKYHSPSRRCMWNQCICPGHGQQPAPCASPAADEGTSGFHMLMGLFLSAQGAVGTNMFSQTLGPGENITTVDGSYSGMTGKVLGPSKSTDISGSQERDRVLQPSPASWMAPLCHGCLPLQPPNSALGWRGAWAAVGNGEGLRAASAQHNTQLHGS